MKTQAKYAGFWTRFTAYVLDSLILGIPFVLIVMPIIGQFALDVEAVRQQIESEDLSQYFALYSALVKVAVMCAVVWATILALLTCSKWQATPGKRIMEIFVMDSSGGKPKFLQCFLRYLALPLLLLTIQTPERFYIYENLEALAQNADASQADLQASFNTPISGFVSLLTLAVLCVWYGLIAMRPQKTAGHDILFNTRVIYGRAEKI